jgi:hypothetical protein
MNRDNIRVVLEEARKLTNHLEYVVMGSLSILGTLEHPPAAMTMSNDVDFYPRNDPDRASEIAKALGQGSPFEIEHGYYADALRPSIAALPEGWKDRLIRHEFETRVIAFYLDPDDAAVAKLARSEARDRRWAREGLAAGILNAETIRKRMVTAPFLDQAEHDRAHEALTAAIKAAAGKTANRE